MISQELTYSEMSVKQPKALYFISASNCWERFGYYTARSILVLYMIQKLLFTPQKAYAIFASFTALLYLAPLLGGYLADVCLGSKRSVLLGGILLSVGYFLLSISGMNFFYAALAMVTIGNGLFMPNISNTLGEIYAKNDIRREGGFSILYSAVNIGAFVPPLITAGIISLYGWNSAFFIAGIGTLIGVAIFYFFNYRHSVLPKIKKTSFLIIGSTLISTVFFSIFLIRDPQIANKVLFIIGGVLLLKIIIDNIRLSGEARNKLLACLILTAFSILFCVLCEQAGMSLTLYTEYNVNRHIANYVVPTFAFLGLNPLFIIMFGPLVSKLWTKLEEKKINPSISAKFALGTILIGLGFIILPLGISLQQSSGQINLWWMVLSYLLQSIGELFVMPVGLSMITTFSPKNMVGLMIGVWYFATAVANVLAGMVSIWTVHPSGNSSPLVTSAAYSTVFGTLGWSALFAGIILLGFVKSIGKLMEGKIDPCTGKI